jgi:hypothetical protein
MEVWLESLLLSCAATAELIAAKLCCTGGFVGGSSNEEKYDPKDLMNLAIDELEEPIVFVSFK